MKLPLHIALFIALTYFDFWFFATYGSVKEWYMLAHGFWLILLSILYPVYIMKLIVELWIYFFDL